MKILVTGGAGFIGSHTSDLLIKQGHKIVIVDNLSTGSKENINPKTTFYLEDLNNFEKIQEIFIKEAPEIVYHFAAQIDVRESINNPIKDAQENLINTLNLLELTIKHNIKHFIFASSGGAIYNKNSKMPIEEDAEEKPISPYGCAKLAIDKYLNFYNKVYSLKYTSLRYSNVYGPKQIPHGEAGVIAVFFTKMLNNQDAIIFGGTQTRDFVYVEDVAQANLSILEDKKSEIYNVGTGKETNITEIFLKINNYFNNKFNPEYREMKKGELKRSCLSFEKIKQTLNWAPVTSLNEGLDKVYHWYLKNYKKEV